MPIAAQINGRLYAIDVDHLNTPRRLTNERGQVEWQWVLGGFGEVGPTTAAGGYRQGGAAGGSDAQEVRFDLRYAGQVWDEESGLAYNLSRYYEREAGRYVQADPIGLAGGWNRYGYALGDPLSFVDPLGLWSVTFGGYIGPGGQVTFGTSNGNGFITVRIGLGVGGGFSYNAAGSLPGDPPDDPSRGGIVAACSANTSFNAGPLQAGAQLGVARNYNNRTSSWLSPFTASSRVSNGWLNGGSIWNANANANVGAQMTIYGGRK